MMKIVPLNIKNLQNWWKKSEAFEYMIFVSKKIK